MKLKTSYRIFNISILLFINNLTLIISIIPLWDFQNSVIDLLPNANSEKTYIIYEEPDYNFQIKKIIKKDSDNSITEINTIYKDSNLISTTEWEALESIYNINNNIYVCPRGKYHMHKLNTNPISFEEIKPDNFNYDGNWDLKCYHQSGEKYFFIFYLNNFNLIYYSKQNNMESSSFTSNSATVMYNGVCDYKWTTSMTNEEGNDVYLMAVIVIKENYINLLGTKVTINGYLNDNRNQDVNRNDINSNQKDLIDNLNSSGSFAYFSDTSEDFYFYSYNDTSLKSGYYEGSTSVSYDTITLIGDINKNEDSILNFFYDYSIKKISYVGYTKYLYYEIYNTEKQKTYYGFIDIKLNKILFNTDEEIKTFKPLKKSSDTEINSMLIITDSSAYEICSIYDSNSNSCTSSCTGSSLIVDSRGKNFCGTECTTNYIMMPEEICIDECDENLFYILGKQCGFCKDLNSTHSYKLINTTGCLNDIPEGAEYYKEKFLLLKCKENYTLIDGSCIPIETETEIKTQKIEKLCEESMGIFNFSNKNNDGQQNYSCYPKDSYIKNFYLDSSDNYFKPCYESCLNCSKKGDKINHNCLACESGYMKKPYGPEKDFNCVAYCEYFYISIYNQFKCVESLPCPPEANYLIKERKECTDDCQKDSKYQFSFEGYCYEECPPNTYEDNYKCKVDIEEFSLNEKNIELNYTSFVESIDSYVSIYANEFSYTDNHVTKFKNDEYEAIIYKNSDSINELSLDFPNFDFGNCYKRVKNYYNISENENLIVMVINKVDENTNNPITSYSFFHPNTSEKLKSEEICKNETISVKENISSLIKNLSNYETIMSLLTQGINVFNKSDKFYTDLCYDYNYKTQKDIALQDRINIFYPNISLCDSGCNQTNINLENMTANCECEFSDITSRAKKDEKSSIKENVWVENLAGDILEYVDSSNIAVGKCIKKTIKNIAKCHGIYFFLVIFVINIIFTVLYFVIDLNKIRVYIYNTSRDFLKYISLEINNINSPPPRNNNKNNNDNKRRTENNKKTTNKRGKKIKTLDLKNNKIENLNIMIEINNNNNNNKKKNATFKSKINSTARLMLDSKKKSTIKYTDKQNQKNQQIKEFFDEYFSESLDEMEYDDAIKKDNRKFCIAFYDILNDKQIILNTFVSKDPFKPRSIKIILFCLNIALYFVVNALFINDSYISEVYKLESENFFSFIPRSIDRFFYTALVSIAIEFIVDFFFVEEKKMKRMFLREQNDKSAGDIVLKQEIVLLVKLIKIRYLAFIIVNYLILIICLYYILCFNSIYPKIQVEWIKSTVFIILLRQVLSLLQCLLETSFRFLSFRFEMERFFKVSKLVN